MLKQTCNRQSLDQLLLVCEELGKFEVPIEILQDVHYAASSMHTVCEASQYTVVTNSTSRALPDAKQTAVKKRTAKHISSERSPEAALSWPPLLPYVTCHALYTTAALVVRDGHHSTIARQHLVPESCLAQEPADKVQGQ